MHVDLEYCDINIMAINQCFGECVWGWGGGRKLSACDSRFALPEGSANLRTKYLLESDTGSTATPGWASTGHMANSSPAEH